MKCITFESKVTHLSLLTHTDKVQKIEEVFSKIRHKSDVFIPDEAFYGTEVHAEDPERMADVLFRWLGIKHRNVRIHIDPSQQNLISYTHEKNASRINLNLQTLEDPLLCGAVVAHAIMHHLVIARAKISLGNSDENEALTDLATIYAGFGVLILNGFEAKQPPLGSMGMQNYASEFLDYCSEHRIVKSLWLSSVLPSVATQFLATKSRTQRLKPYLSRRLQKIKKRKRKVLAGLFLTTVIISSAVVFSPKGPQYLSPLMQEKRENIVQLKSQYELCTGIVEYKQQKWDKTDIFIQRQIEADKSRCSSLKNRYNYEVKEFNSKL